MQEADRLGSKHCDRSVVLELSEDGNFMVSVSDEGAETTFVPKDAPDVLMTHDLEQNRRLSVSAGVTSEAEKGQGTAEAFCSAKVAHEALETFPECLGELHQVESNVVACSSNEEVYSVQSMSGDSGGSEKEWDQVISTFSKKHGEECLSGRSNEPEVKQLEAAPLPETKTANSFGENVDFFDVDGRSISLPQLAKVLRQLSEDDFGFLISSRETVDCAALALPTDCTAQVAETFQEQIYLANISKDFFHLQLIEQTKLLDHFDCQHHQLIDVVSVLTASLEDVEERNRSLNSELSQCRSELQGAICAKEDINVQFDSVKSEVKEFSAAVDELKVELAECKGLLAASKVENGRLLDTLSSVTEEKNKVEEVKEQCFNENKKLSVELAESRSSLASIQAEIADFVSTLASMASEKRRLEEAKDFFRHENEKLLVDLTKCKDLLLALEEENSRLNANLATMREQQQRLEEDREFFIHERERLSSEIVGYQEKLSVDNCRCMTLEDDLKVARSHLKQLNVENIFLNRNLETHKDKLDTVDDNQSQLSSEASEFGNQLSGHIHIVGQKDSERMPVKQVIVAPSVFNNPASEDSVEGSASGELKGDANDDSGFVMLKGLLDEAEKVMQDLEKAVEGMHSLSASLSWSVGKAAAPGVSKLIQAFESKAQDHELDGTPLSGSQVPADPYLSAKEQTRNLRAVFKVMCQHVEHASYLFRIEKNGHQVADVALGKLEIQINVLKDYSSILELKTIELDVLYTAMHQHAYNIEARKTAAETSYESLKAQEVSLRSEKNKLDTKLTNYHARITELQGQSYELRRSSSKMASEMCNQVESLQKEMVEKVYAVEMEWKSTLGTFFQMVEKLDVAAGQLSDAPTLTDNNDYPDICRRVSVSVHAACELIEGLKTRLEDAFHEREALSSSFFEMEKKLDALHEENELTVGLLKKISGDLLNILTDSPRCLEEGGTQACDNGLHDLLDMSHFESLIKQLKELNNKLQSDLLDRRNIIEELNKTYVDPHALLKLVDNILGVLNLQGIKLGFDESPLLHLQSSVSMLLEKYTELDEVARILREDINSRMTEMHALQGEVEHLNSFNFQQQNEILVLKESLNQAKEVFTAVSSELQEKVTELELSEQRVASVREKLSIAVAKGKGLVVQRDSLKQSLVEASSELERCSQELQLKDSRHHEVEEKLKAYSEAGERMEALESELSYIRNSATALRESFLLKDSALQRIEEILEDLELPEHFHCKGIIEKVDWLAKFVVGNSVPPSDWDQRNTMGAGSYSDVGFAIMDTWKEDGQPDTNPVDDLRRKYDELQSKFIELAEQNEMLEQSLMGRNDLVQRWEQVLERINTPPQLRSMEPEERIEWLGSALSESDCHLTYLQREIDRLENYCGLLSTDLEESKTRVSSLESSLQAVIHERDSVHQRLVDFASDRERALEQVAQLEHENDKLRNDVNASQEKLVEKLRLEEQVEVHIVKLQHMIIDASPDSGSENMLSDGSTIDCLEQLLSDLIENYTRLAVDSAVKEETYNSVPEDAAKLDEPSVRGAADEKILEHVDADVGVGDIVFNEGPTLVDLRRELDEVKCEIVLLTEQRDGYMEKCQSLASEVETLAKKDEELRELLNQGEQKSFSLREKLNVAVRRGKQLVQQRDSLKQNVEEMMTEIDQLKSNLNIRENAISELEQKITVLSSVVEQHEAVESENLVLKNQLTEVDECLQKAEHTLSMIFNKMGEIDTADQLNVSDPVLKLEGIKRLCSDLRAAVASYEQESKKSKRAADLLLEELNEVQERNDVLQEELAKAYDEISNLSREREVAESAKLDALSHRGKLFEERIKQLAELEELKSSLHELEKEFFDFSYLIVDVFMKDVELQHNLSAALESSLKLIDSELPPVSVSDTLFSQSLTMKDLLARASFWGSKMQDQSNEGVEMDVCNFIRHRLYQFATIIGDLKERIRSHSKSLHEEAEHLKNGISNLQRGVISQKEYLESVKAEFLQLESTEKERDMHAIAMHRSISLLYEACASSIVEIESRKAQLVGNGLANEDAGVTMKSLALADGGTSFSSQNLSSSEECIKTLADRLLLAVKDFVRLHAENIEACNKELRSTVSNLQSELQEKDIQKDQICMELVSQIKEAEISAKKYSQDLESTKSQVHELEKRIEVMEKERRLLEERVVDLQQKQVMPIELEEKVKSLTDILASKEQEIEGLMQALDEEENQMEGLRNNIEQLEEVVQKKNLDLQHLEASCAKAVKKLSVTVTKFDELHHMSEGLLFEIENLQLQLQDRDAEISFLRQEVTRCTNDVLLTSKMSKERKSNELHEFLTWLDTLCSGVLTRDVQLSDDNYSQDSEYREHLQKDITSLISELEDLRVVAQNRDALLQAERNKVEELMRRKEALEASLHEKESHLTLQDARDLGGATSEIVEVEPVINKWKVPVTSTASQFRSLRKANNDQVSIAVDADLGGTGRLEDEEDDKIHGFKSLTTLRLVPKFTRPMSDMIDGLWVSCDRALMRQPAFRLGIIIYWAVLHILLAAFVV
ncbi:hypothetical protein Ancab_007147 [Ancistrocladus abbreviatus]